MREIEAVEGVTLIGDEHLVALSASDINILAGALSTQVPFLPLANVQGTTAEQDAAWRDRFQRAVDLMVSFRALAETVKIRE